MADQAGSPPPARLDAVTAVLDLSGSFRLPNQALMAHGVPPQILVIGPAGSGKVALVDHLRSQAAGGPDGGAADAALDAIETALAG